MEVSAIWCLNIWCILFYRKYLLCLGARFMQAYTAYPNNQAESYSRCLLHSHLQVRPSSLFPPLHFIPFLSLYSPNDTSPLPPPAPCLYPVVPLSSTTLSLQTLHIQKHRLRHSHQSYPNRSFFPLSA